MKKNPKKLVLNRETLANLEECLGQVAGGDSHYACWSGYRTCGTCNNQTCGTNLC